MYSAVERILEGNFNKDNRTLEFSTPVITLSAEQESVCEGSFTIFGPENEVTEGSISTTSTRMICPVDSFAGAENVIPYSFDTFGLSVGDCVKGEFRIISNQGEYMIPYDIRIEASNLDTSLGNIKNLFHFTNLARTNWDEAVSLFHSDEFEGILVGVERQYISAYKALSGGANRHQNLEEFLLHIKKKQPVYFIPEEENIRIDSVNVPMTKSITIKRNGWGYSSLRVKSLDNIISVSQDSIDEHDFDANTARINFSLTPEALHDGKNIGRIRIYNAYNDIIVTISAFKNPLNRKVADMMRETKHLLIDLMQYYQGFRCHKISASTWMKETGAIVDKLCELDPENKKYELLHVQLLITQERFNEARWILEQNEEAVRNMNDEVAYCYYYYLNTLIDRDEKSTEEACRLVEDAYDSNPGEWRLAWLLLYLSSNYTKSGIERWEFLKELYSKGATSPVIYIEAYQVLCNNVTILNSLGEFETQVLKYMAKKDVLTPDVIDQFIYILRRGKSYDASLLPLLEHCYEVYQSDDVLSSICKLLINVGKYDAAAFKWYAMAVDKQLRITRLYENYMMSINMDGLVEIPKIVLMYFAYDSSLDAEHNAFLYAYVYRSRALMPELYASYMDTIERFTMFQLLAGNNNTHLAYLYRNIVNESMITEDVAKGMSKAIFIHEFRTERKNITKIIIKYENLTEQFEYPVKNGRAFIPLYGSNYQLVLEDEDQNRFSRESEYTIERLMLPDKYASILEPMVDADILFDLWMCEHGKDLGYINENNVESMKRLSLSSKVVPKVRQKINAGLFKFYYDSDRVDELDEILETIRIEDVPSESLTEIIKFMIFRGKHEKAYEWVCLTAGEGLEPKLLARLCSRMLSFNDYRDEEEEDPQLLSLIYRIYQCNKFEEPLLKYLVKYFRGTCKEMAGLRKNAKEFGVDVHDLETQIIYQQLYSNAFLPGVFDIFCSVAENRQNDQLVLAYLSQVSYDYFVCDKVTDERYVGILQRYIDEDIQIPFVCKLAYTKYYSSKARDLEDKIARSVTVFLKEIMVKGMYFPYFKEYAQTITYMHRFLDKTMVGYKVTDNHTATIHYMIEKDRDTEGEYIKEEMKNMYHGICVKQFVLFFGEKLQYYIVEHDGDNEQLTQSGEYARNDMDQPDHNSKYSMINDIAISKTLGDYGTMDSLLTDYFQKEYLLEALFKMPE